jgi:hypothetical protein
MFAVLAVLFYFLRTRIWCDHVAFGPWWDSHGGAKRTRFCSDCGKTETRAR